MAPPISIKAINSLCETHTGVGREQAWADDGLPLLESASLFFDVCWEIHGN